MADAALQRNVVEELLWDPKVDSDSIAVSADDHGAVILRGTGGSLRQKREAKKAVTNELDVRLLTEHRRADADVRGDVLQALMLDAVVPATIEASVKDRVVTLPGSAERYFQIEEAEFVAGNARGVAGVETDVDLVGPAPRPDDVERAIEAALERDAKLDADNIVVASSNGTVTLRQRDQRLVRVGGRDAFGRAGDVPQPGVGPAARRYGSYPVQRHQTGQPAAVVRSVRRGVTRGRRSQYVPAGRPGGA